MVQYKCACVCVCVCVHICLYGCSKCMYAVYSDFWWGEYIVLPPASFDILRGSKLGQRYLTFWHFELQNIYTYIFLKNAHYLFLQCGSFKFNSWHPCECFVGQKRLIETHMKINWLWKIPVYLHAWCGSVLLRQFSQNPMLTEPTYNGTEELGRRLCITTTEKNPGWVV